MHISILTASGNYNLGDELILSEEFSTLKKAYPEATFSLFTYDEKSCIFKDDQAKFISFFPNRAKSQLLKNLGYLINNIITIARSDFIVIGGGGLIYDRETQKNMFPIKQWMFRVFIARLFRTPIVWWSVGINIGRSTQKHLPFLFYGKRIIVTVRDKKSYEVLHDLGITSTILPDSVLGYIPPESKSKKTKKQTIGISLRTGFTANEEALFSQIINYLRERKYNIIFLSQSIHPEDIRANDATFATQFAQPEDVITQTIEETLSAYTALDFVIGMRLHSLILAFVHAVPFLALSYETKTQELLRDLGYDFKVSTKTMNFEKFIEQFLRLENQTDTVKFALQAKNDTIKQQLEVGESLLLKKIDELISKK